MSEETKTAVQILVDSLIKLGYLHSNEFGQSPKVRELINQAKEIEGDRMRSYIEEKWKQYRIVTNEEDAWLFKEWLIQQTYGGGEQ